jgi:hypothetical protein
VSPADRYRGKPNDELIHELVTRDSTISTLQAIVERQAAEADDLRTWPGRIKAAWIVINQPGGLAILLLAAGLALYTGYLPSPVTRTEAKVDQHISNVKEIVQARSEEQRELVGALKRLTEQIERRNARDRVKECGEIKDVDLRRECLRF